VHFGSPPTCGSREQRHGRVPLPVRDGRGLAQGPPLSQNKTYGLYRGELGYWLHIARYQILRVLA